MSASQGVWVILFFFTMRFDTVNAGTNIHMMDVQSPLGFSNEFPELIFSVKIHDLTLFVVGSRDGDVCASFISLRAPLINMVENII
jgi:hypothetical protein